MIVRFRGKEGTYRVTVEATNSFAEAVALVSKQLPPHSAVRVALQPGGQAHAATPDWASSLADLGIKHGDMFFVEYDPPAEAAAEMVERTNPPSALAVVDKVDGVLDSQDGKIKRGRSSMCRHGPNGMCEYCQPLDSYDEEYRVEHGIKHLSYHAYIKKLQNESGSKKVLEEPSYKVLTNCPSGHSAWPNGICSKCQPSAITLQQQRFRLVDHVEFADPSIVNTFIDYWRQTNTQRIGIMLGEYVPYTKVPLGIKAVVHAIYEPQQTGVSDGLTLESLPDAHVDAAARALGLKPVGVIFSDLVDAGTGDGRVLNKRHAHSYFLSSLEIAFAARIQIQHPNASTHSDSGTYSSKFVTCVVSGNAAGEIDMACYQVSVQAEKMITADLIVPSANPAVMRIKPETKTRYVPDIFFKHINQYNLAVQEDAKPAFPVDYLLVSLTHGFPETPSPRLENTFPIENRPSMRAQTVPQLVDILELSDGFSDDHLTDFHLLAYLLSLGVLQPSEQELLAQLLAVTQTDPEGSRRIDLATQLAHSDGFNTLRILAQN